VKGPGLTHLHSPSPDAAVPDAHLEDLLRKIFSQSRDSMAECEKAMFDGLAGSLSDSLVLFGATPRFVRAPEFPWLPTRAEQEHFGDDFVAKRFAGEVVRLLPRLRSRAPSATDDEVREFARINRLSVSPGAMAAYNRMNLDIDVRAVLPTIRVPTLVLYRSEEEVPSAMPITIAFYRSKDEARRLADAIHDARVVPVPGPDPAAASAPASASRASASGAWAWPCPSVQHPGPACPDPSATAAWWRSRPVGR